jgi:hypothetical protein
MTELRDSQECKPLRTAPFDQDLKLIWIDGTIRDVRKIKPTIDSGLTWNVWIDLAEGNEDYDPDDAIGWKLATEP